MDAATRLFEAPVLARVYQVLEMKQRTQEGETEVTVLHGVGTKLNHKW